MLQVFTMYDNKAKQYGRQMHFLTKDECIFEITEFINAENNNLASIEWDLFHLGEYCQATGKCYPLENPEHLFNLSSLIKKETENA